MGETVFKLFILAIGLYLILKFSRSANNIANSLANGVNGTFLALQGRDPGTGSSLFSGGF